MGSPKVGANPVWIQSSNDGSKIYVLNQGSGTVTVISTSDFSVLATLPVGAAPTTATISAAGLLFVADQGSNSVSVIDIQDNAMAGSKQRSPAIDLPIHTRLELLNSRPAPRQAGHRCATRIGGHHGP